MLQVWDAAMHGDGTARNETGWLDEEFYTNHRERRVRLRAAYGTQAAASLEH
jgi:hypothetical protein